MPNYEYDDPDDAYKEAQRRIKKAKNESATVLRLDELGLTAVPPGIGQLTELTTLYLYTNQLTNIPSKIGQLTGLTYLDLSGNQLTAVPPEIGQLTELAVLDLSGNQLTAVPSEIGQLTALTKLWLHENQLTAVPPEILQLTGLMHLDLSVNKLTAVPPEILQLTGLTTLSLGENQLTAVPSEILQLTALTGLWLHENQLTAVPPEIRQLTALTNLALDKNQLTAVPPEIGQLTGLTELALNKNQLTTIPPEITQLTKLDEFWLTDNPDLPIPPEITSQSGNPQAIFDYIRGLNTAPAENIPLNEAKVILVGRGEAGKTSLVKRLVYNTFDPNQKQTDGVDITPWQLPVDRPAQGIVPIALNIWDFGGQEILHATHKFFLTERSLYLIVIEPRKDSYRQDVEYWLSLINDVAADSPVIIVINKIDLQRIDVDRHGLFKKYPDIIQAFIPISAQSGEGIPLLKEAIAAALVNMKEVDTPFSDSWMRVKQALTKMKATHPHIPYSQYDQLCKNEGIADESPRRTLIGFLHRLGIVLNFQDDGRVRNTNVLDPNWITNGVYTIITNPLPQTNKGNLKRNQLLAILPRDEYPESQHNYLLEMMVKFELAYELDRDTVLIPDLIAEEEPLYKWDDEDSIQFEYQYEVLRRSTLHRLMVRRHKQINPTVVWRTGVMLQRDGISALIRADIEAKTICISINGQGDDGSYGPRQFLHTLRGEFADIHDSKGTKPQEVVPIPNHPTAAPIGYTYLLQLEENKLETIPYPDKNGQVLMLDVQQLLDGVSTSAMRKAGLGDVEIPVNHNIPNPSRVAALIAAGETQCAEFKSSFQWDYRQNKVNKQLRLPVMKNIAAFMNSDGGVLIIGVDDDGKSLGLDHDVNSAGKKNLDGFENLLNDIFATMIGIEHRQFMDVHFPVFDELTICVLVIRPSSLPIYLAYKDKGKEKESFYIRTGNSSRELPISKATQYIQTRSEIDYQTLLKESRLRTNSQLFL